jgi:hypothetical protein
MQAVSNNALLAIAFARNKRMHALQHHCHPIQTAIIMNTIMTRMCLVGIFAGIEWTSSVIASLTQQVNKEHIGHTSVRRHMSASQIVVQSRVSTISKRRNEKRIETVTGVGAS